MNNTPSPAPLAPGHDAPDGARQTGPEGLGTLVTSLNSPPGSDAGGHLLGKAP